MKTDSKKAKFFCENCGSEVPENAKVCKACGKFFISVRCPQCGATGSHNDFLNGCPSCGYAVNGSHSKTRSAKSANQLQEKKSIIWKKQHNYTDTSYVHKESSLPIWVYVFTGCILLAILGAIFKGCI